MINSQTVSYMRVEYSILINATNHAFIYVKHSDREKAKIVNDYKEHAIFYTIQ